MKYILFLVILTTISIAWSQEDSTRVKEVQNVVNQLFDAMRSGNSARLKEVLHINAKLYSTHQKDDGFQLSSGSIDDFVEAVGAPHDKVWDERISNVIIQLNDGLAHVWMDYSFYIGEEFSHEGVNSILLVEVDNRWQIITIADTRRSK